MDRESFLAQEISGLSSERIKMSGKTMVIDRFAYDLSVLDRFAPFVTYVKLGWGIPFLLNEVNVKERIRTIREKGIGVSNGGTFLENFMIRGKLMKGLSVIKSLGFDYIELSEGIMDVSRQEKNIISEFAGSNNMRLIMEVGKKNRNDQLSLQDTIEKIHEDMEFNPFMVIIEGRESGKDVEIYDHEGNIKWDWVEEILDQIPLERVMFEAPIESQQTELIIRLGNQVNLGNISLYSIPAMASQRFGVRGDNFGVDYHGDEFHGSPATRFVYHVIKNSVSSDQAKIMRITGMSRRTVQNSLFELLKTGMISEFPDSRDLRRKIYRVKAQRNL
ncbi:phosphosulfolactate synthase [Cuniculiplasma sp. SKW4]|uniref:phosphosulfolactate synthase n=1 Tax=Cuniculiplasma sp. SKW4 TaxID=3400171 RepID=UPI003FD4FD30